MEIIKPRTRSGFMELLPAKQIRFEKMVETIRHCDRHNVPVATNLASAEMLIMGLQRGDLDWREMVHTKLRY